MSERGISCTSKKGLTAPRLVSCEMCSTRFMAVRTQSRYCSDECRQNGLRKSWREYANRNKEKRRARGKESYKRNRQAVLDRTKAYNKTAAGRAARRKADLNQLQNHPEKVAARTAITLAVRKGEITKQHCVVCGGIEVQGHHEDYSLPLDVVWLCRAHHNAVHRGEIVIEDGMIKK